MNKYLTEGEWVYENIKHSWLNIVVYFDGAKPCNVELALYMSFQWSHVKGTGKIVSCIRKKRLTKKSPIRRYYLMWFVIKSCPLALAYFDLPVDVFKNLNLVYFERKQSDINLTNQFFEV